MASSPSFRIFRWCRPTLIVRLAEQGARACRGLAEISRRCRDKHLLRNVRGHLVRSSELETTPLLERLARQEDIQAQPFAQTLGIDDGCRSDDRFHSQQIRLAHIQYPFRPPDLYQEGKNTGSNFRDFERTKSYVLEHPEFAHWSI